MHVKPLEWHRVGVALFLFATVISESDSHASMVPTITIGGVVFTDLRNPIRSGLQGVTVTVEGQGGTFQATTSGVIGLWKMDVPEGTYTVTPKKTDYAMQHLVGGWCDGQPAITIDVKPENMAANQSIQFLAIDWLERKPQPEPESQPQPQLEPEPEPQQAAPAPEIRETGQTGGGCATTRGRQGRAADFFAPYAACLSLLFVTTCVDKRKRHRRRQ